MRNLGWAHGTETGALGRWCNSVGTGLVQDWDNCMAGLGQRWDRLGTELESGRESVWSWFELGNITKQAL